MKLLTGECHKISLAGGRHVVKVMTWCRRAINWYLSQYWPSSRPQRGNFPDSKVHGANMGSIWGRQDHPGGPHVGPMNFVIRELLVLKLEDSGRISIACPQSSPGQQHSCYWPYKTYGYWFYLSALRAGGLLSQRSGRLGGRAVARFLRNAYLWNHWADFFCSKFFGIV